MAKMTEAMLTTIDNPYDPFDSFLQWYNWDTSHGYYTSAYLGRVMVTSHELSLADQLLANEQAIDEIVEENINGMYKKVTRDFDSEELIV